MHATWQFPLFLTNIDCIALRRTLMSVFMLVSVHRCHVCYLWAAVAASIGHLQPCTSDRATGRVSFWAAVPGNNCHVADSNTIWLIMSVTRSIFCLHAAPLSVSWRNRACSCLFLFMTHRKQQSLQQPCLMLQGFSVADFLESIQKQSDAEAEQRNKTA